MGHTIKRTNKSLHSINCIDENNVWLVGDGGSILHTTNGGVTFIEDEKNSTQPQEFLLQQNYPNPFNPSTKISWQSPVSSWQTVKIYDILGNEVATLVNEYRQAGNYEVDFESTVGNHQLANGVYFYRLQAGEFVETKKMVLLK
ncbi:MAG: T9SS type A sorting domain-containing protein [Ignavibacteriales bacterium]|nr:T9SS type A sorting domain-containing protein [Ignavibacteriales bacterium]